jgi:hypothetical protein
MIKKRVTFSRELSLEHRWLTKVRKVIRKARHSRERADMWGNELTRYLGKFSI